MPLFNLSYTQRNSNNATIKNNNNGQHIEDASMFSLRRRHMLTVIPEQPMQKEEDEATEEGIKNDVDGVHDDDDSKSTKNINNSMSNCDINETTEYRNDEKKLKKKAAEEEEEEYQKHFANIAEQQQLNSSFADYKGGLLTTAPPESYKQSTINSLSSLSSTQNEDSITATENYVQQTSAKTFSEQSETISTKPSNSSKHFENTFKLLQNQVEATNQKTLDVLQSLSTEDESITSSLTCTLQSFATSVEELPPRLELELEAMQRIRRIVDDLKSEQINAVVDKEESTNICDLIKSSTDARPSSLSLDTTPLLAFYHDFVAKGQSTKNDPDKVKCDATLLDRDTDATTTPDAKCSESSETRDLIYHASKNMDGKNCLRVVRSLLTNTVLCGNRVSQMTRAYDDIEAVTRLLEEKEKDLELTVQIGKELLTQNNALEARINDLEADLKTSNDDRAQLVHELHKKNELISVLTNDSDDGNDMDTPTLSKSITLDLMQKKIASLQDENKSLKSEASMLALKTDEVEAHERQLMEDIGAQLNDANSQFDNLSLELERQREENRLQHEQIVSLTARLAEAEMRLHQLTHDNDEHLSLLNITKENQNALALELVEFKQRYEEVLALLHAAQDQLKQQRKKTLPQARSSFIGGFGTSGIGGGVGGGMLRPESLQSELMESSLYSENSLDSGISGDSQRSADRISRLMSQLPGGVGVGGSLAASGLGLGAGNTLGGSMMMAGSGGAVPPYKRIFDTVRCASKHGNYADSGNVSMSQLGAMSMSSASGPRMSSVAYPAGSYYRGSSNSLGLKTLSTESLNSASDDGYPAQPSGVPGAPGAKELEAALKRLTPAEVLARRAMLSYAPAGTYNYDEPTQANLPLGVRTPDSIMSTGSSGMSLSAHLSASMSHQWRLPEKLQIVKPMEGSQTLHHWSRLATPTLSGLLDERPGVTIRGGRGLDDLGMQVYTLSDVEEDVSEDLPGKQFETNGCTYTYTTSMVMHPDDGFVNDLSFLSESQMSSRMASTSTSRQPSCPPTPRTGLSRKNSCSTFSVNLGLASMLNERGIKAVTPSALNTPAGPNFTPTVTPCNSPEGSPPRSQSPEPLFGLLTSGADLIRRKLVGGEMDRPNRNVQQSKQQKIMLSRLERRALRSLKLVEKVESIGLENIITTQASASGIANRSSSPMSQLGSLRQLHTSSNSIVDDIQFDRAQIKGVLHKGLNSPVPSMSSSTSAYNSDSGDEQLAGISGDSDDQGIVLKMKPKHASSSSTTTPKAIKPAAAASTASTTTTKATTSSIAQNVHQQPSVGLGGASGSTVTETRLKQMQRQKSRRNLKNGMATQRPDLGTIGGNGGGGRVRPDLGKVSGSAMSMSDKRSASDENKANEAKSSQSITQSFVGSVSSLLFGRKGGWL